MLAHGADITVDTNPFEVGMGYEWMVDQRKEADFIGRAALTRIKESGPVRRLAGVEIGGAALGTYNDGSMIDVMPIDHDRPRVSQVSLACHSPRREKKVAE